MTEPAPDMARWERLLSFSETFTCYSAAMATWAAAEDEAWPAAVNPGLTLTITEAADGIFGFAYFPASLRARLGLVRHGANDAADAVAGILHEVEVRGRAIVAGDGFHLPWHVAFERRHVPHWYVLEDGPEGLVICDAFVARNELGAQTATRRPVTPGELPPLLHALPEDDPVLRLRELFAFGDDTAPFHGHAYQWFAGAEVDAVRAPSGPSGPQALRRLARHFRERGQDLEAYRQADDIWSVGRHRAFLARHAAEVAASRRDGALSGWLEEHAEPLVKRWSHVAPLLMQATLSLRSGRSASSSVPDVLDELAEREQEAAGAFAGDLAALA